MEDSATEREMTPPELVAFLLKRFEVETVEELAVKIGQPARQIYRWRNGQEPRFGTTISLLEDAGLIRWEDEQLAPDEAAAYLNHLHQEYGETLFDFVRRQRLLESAVLGWLAERDGPYAEAVAALLPQQTRQADIHLSRLEAVEKGLDELADLIRAELVDQLAESEAVPAAVQKPQPKKAPHK